MKVLLLQLDGKIPNIALMRIAAHHRALGDSVELRRAGNAAAVESGLFDSHDLVFASLVFERTRPLAERLLEISPNAVIGGTGWSITKRLEDVGITTREQDYSIYPRFEKSIGFTQRGCRLKCSFCVVPRKEGAVTEEQTIAELWRGEPYPRELLLLDNDFFGQPRWRDRIAELRKCACGASSWCRRATCPGTFRVSFNQGINARFLDDESAAAIASVDYRDDSMKTRRIYTAWDSRKDEARLFRGLDALVRAGVKPAHIMVYMLIGYWPGETHEDRDYRRQRLREFGAVPWPMPFERTPELAGFQRWVVGAFDKKIGWREWTGARRQPRNLVRPGSQRSLPIFDEQTS